MKAVLIVVALGLAIPALGQSEVSFPQFVDGGGTSSDVILTNSRPSLNVCEADFYSDNGTLSTNLGGPSRKFAIQSYGTVVYSTPGVGAATSGWVQVLCDTDITGIVKMNLPGIGSASVGAATPQQYGTLGFILPVSHDMSGLDTGIAIVLSDFSSIPLVALHTVLLTLRDSSGNTIGTNVMTFPVSSTAVHIARYISQLFPAGPWTQPNFNGTLAIQSDFYATLVNAFRIGPGEFVVYPVGALLSCATEYQAVSCPNQP